MLLENYSTGTLDALGLGYEAIRARNPRIIYCAMTGYGAPGDKAAKGAYDNTIQAASGAIAQSRGIKPGVMVSPNTTSKEAANIQNDSNYEALWSRLRAR